MPATAKKSAPADSPISGEHEWLQKHEVCKILGVSHDAVTRIVLKGCLVVRQFPGCFPRYRRDSVEDLAEQYTRERTYDEHQLKARRKPPAAPTKQPDRR